MPYGVGPDGQPVWIPASAQLGALRGAAEGAASSLPARALGRVAGGAAHALTAPLRGVSALAHNIAGVGDRMDVSDAMLYGYDVDTGQAPVPYGTALRRVVAGEEGPGDAPTGYWTDKLLDVVETAGNVISDPMALAAGVAGASRLGAGAGGTSPAAAAQVRALSNQGAAKAAPKPKIKFAGEALDMDLAPAGPQNRVYSFPSRLRAWGREGRRMRQREAGRTQYGEPAGPPPPRGYAPEGGGPAMAEGEAREALVREGFMDPGEAAPSTLLDTDLVRGNPATSRLRASELADYLQRQEARRGPGTGAGPGGTIPADMPGSRVRGTAREQGPMFGVPAEEAGAVTRANQLYQTMLALPESARRALMEALGEFVE